jgi:hypothetical protein
MTRRPYAFISRSDIDASETSRALQISDKPAALTRFVMKHGDRNSEVV